jgi:FAD binding domain
MTDVATTKTAIESLRAAVAGPVLTPDQDGYAAEVSGFEMVAEHFPAIAVGATDANDVVATVRIAAAAGIPVTVVGLGHAAIPSVTRGILLNTSRITDVTLDVGARAVRVGAGGTWHDVMAVATPIGLAPVCGSAPGVGVAGYLLGGGLGPIGRTVGFSSDHVRSFEIVCADGDLRTVSAERDADLFWALRGGKGGFGVVTAATVELLEVASLYGGGEFYSAGDIAALFRAYQRFVKSGLPAALSTSLAILRLPELPELPPPLRGQTVGHLRIAYMGGVDADDRAALAEELLAPLRAAVGRPLLGGVGELPYADLGTIHNDPTTPSAQATGGILLERFEPETVDAILDIGGPDVDTPVVAIEVRHLGGALTGAPPRDAVSGREARACLWTVGAPLPPDFEAGQLTAANAGVRAVIDTVAPWSTGGVQINFCGSANTADEAAKAWPKEIADRLAEVRRRYDPATVFPFAPGSRAPARAAR